MSEERKGSGGLGDKKKPRATFGDVMRGIPAGQGGEAGEPRREPRGDRPKREPRPKPAPVAEERPKAAGPLVVIKRAGVVVPSAVSPTPAEAAAPATIAEQVTPMPEPTSSVTLHPPPPSNSVADEVQEAESFAEMFEASAKQEGGLSRRPVRIGEKVTGKIFQLGADTAFVSLGGRSEAMIELNELKDDEGILRFGIGDEIEAHVVEAGAKGILLSRTLAKGSASLAMLAEARATGMPVEGLVLSVNKGGFEVAVGDQRAFVPMSQMDLKFVDKPELFVGEKLRFRVTEVRERKVVLSRRALLEEEQKVLAEQTRKTLDEGKIVRGKVTGVRDFGAFVDLGGIEGMIPVSELSHTRVGHPSEVVKMGDEVEVEILRIEAPNPHSPDKAK
ncbi:MAG TPA: S1 RNA-binding domain-containing protein, partial [Myxococcaceae bacterium]|nr:S1 RNA-binding domain-containing protein [Myxococcaceae bacterium]